MQTCFLTRCCDERDIFLKTQKSKKKTHPFDGKCELVTYIGHENVSRSMSLP